MGSPMEYRGYSDCCQGDAYNSFDDCCDDDFGSERTNIQHRVSVGRCSKICARLSDIQLRIGTQQDYSRSFISRPLLPQGDDVTPCGCFLCLRGATYSSSAAGDSSAAAEKLAFLFSDPVDKATGRATKFINRAGCTAETKETWRFGQAEESEAPAHIKYLVGRDFGRRYCDGEKWLSGVTTWNSQVPVDSAKDKYDRDRRHKLSGQTAKSHKQGRSQVEPFHHLLVLNEAGLWNTLSSVEHVSIFDRPKSPRFPVSRPPPAPLAADKLPSDYTKNCWCCNRKGHKYSQCTRSFGLRRRCFGCGLHDYTKATCPNCSKKYEEEIVRFANSRKNY